MIAGIWVAAVITLAVYSFLYGDNPLYKVAEHLFVGISAAYGTVILYNTGVLPKLIFPLFSPDKVDLPGPNYLVLLPALLGLMFFGRFIPRWSWMSRWPIAFIVGLGSGAAIPVVFQANILEQAHGTVAPFGPLAPGAPALGVADLIGNWVLAAAVLTTLAYFYFSKPHTGNFGRASRLGVWFLMIAFGAGFGNTVMARVALLIGRLQFLVYQWAPLWWHH
jgi:hypothetical protein